MKKWLLITLLLFSTSSFVNASSIHGDFEGNPIVTLKSNGQDLKVEDVPAINYKDRTLVPIYLLKQLGADVVWDSTSYSVDVKIIKPKDLQSNEKILRDTYKLLSDTDMAIWMLVYKMEQAFLLANPTITKQSVDVDYQEVSNLYNNSLKYFMEISNQIQSDKSISEIISNESKVLEQVNQSKEIFKIWIDQKNDALVSSNLKLNLIYSTDSAQRNILNTNKYIHEIILINK